VAPGFVLMSVLPFSEGAAQRARFAASRTASMMWA